MSFTKSILMKTDKRKVENKCNKSLLIIGSRNID